MQTRTNASMPAVGIAVALGPTAGSVCRPVRTDPDRKEAAMTKQEQNIAVMLEIFRRIEERDTDPENGARELALVQPDAEIHWPASLPYGGVSRGLARRPGETWGETWTPLQPTMAERRMDPRVVGATGDEVAIHYHQRGVSPTGERYDGEVLGLYELRDSKLARAQMFYFDEPAACRFLSRASSLVAR